MRAVIRLAALEIDTEKNREMEDRGGARKIVCLRPGSELVDRNVEILPNLLRCIRLGRSELVAFLDMVGQGHTNKEIAQRLQIELPTVKSHVHNILGKLQVRSRTEAAALCSRGALGSSPEPHGFDPLDDGARRGNPTESDTT